MLEQALPVVPEGPTGTDHGQGSVAQTSLPPASGPDRRQPGRVGRLTFVWALVAFVLLIGAWCLATPLSAAPDEPGHLIQAAAAVRGEIDMPAQPGVYGAISKVRVPEWAGSSGAVPSAAWIWAVEGLLPPQAAAGRSSAAASPRQVAVFIIEKPPSQLTQI